VEKNWEKELPSEVRKWLDNARTKKGGLYASPDAVADAETTTDGKGKLLTQQSKFNQGLAKSKKAVLQQQECVHHVCMPGA
jgi:hypothetical protein